MDKSFFDIPLYEDDLQAVLDKHNIQALVEAERYYRDNQLFELMEQTYSKQSRVRLTWYDGDGREFVRRSSGQQPGVKHKIYSTMIWLRGNKAIAEMQCVMMGAREIVDGVACDTKGYSRLLYKVQKEPDGVWRIKGFDCIYERDWVQSVDGSQMKSLNAGEEVRESYRCLSAQLSRKGLPVATELPGEDRPETIQSLYDEASIWLYED